MSPLMRCGAVVSALVVSFGVVCGAFEAPALAQERDPAAAQALFDQALQLSKQGKYDEACPKFQESNRLDPSIGALFQLANCLEQGGRVASAWAMFLDVASQSRARGQLERETVARDRAAKLEPRLSRLQVNVPEGSKLAGLEIRRNGVLVGSAQWGTPMPIDPGEVELSISAPHKQTLRQSVRLEEAKTFSYSVPTLADAPDEPEPPAEAEPAPAPVSKPLPAPVASQPAAPPPAPAPVLNPNRTWVLGLGAVGLVGLGAGTTFALLAKAKDNQSKHECDNDDVNNCSPLGVQQRNTALLEGNVATVSFIVGGVALAGAGVLWFMGDRPLAPRASASRWRAAPVLSPGSAALFVQGEY